MGIAAYEIRCTLINEHMPFQEHHENPSLSEGIEYYGKQGLLESDAEYLYAPNSVCT